MVTTHHLANYTDWGPLGLGQYDGLGEYCDPSTASSMFLICNKYLVSIRISMYTDMSYVYCELTKG